VASAFASPTVSTEATGPERLVIVSDYLAGWEVTQPTISSASVILDVPTVTCGPDREGTIEGLGSEPVFGDPAVLAGVILACDGGAPFLQQVSVQVDNVSDTNSVSPGDRLRFSIAQTATRVKATVANLTTGDDISAVKVTPPNTVLTFGSFPLFGGGTTLPVADFGTIRMRQPKLDGAALSAASPTRVTRWEEGVKKVTAGAMDPATSNFTLRFRDH
jgi:hypothetical protein